MKGDLIENLMIVEDQHSEQGDCWGADVVDVAIAEIEKLRAKVAAIPPVSGYTMSDDPEYGISDPEDLVERHQWYSGGMPAVYAIQPWRPDPLVHYAIVPTVVVEKMEWTDGQYSGDTEVIGPFATCDEARAEAERVTAERKAEWEAAEGNNA